MRQAFSAVDGICQLVKRWKAPSGFSYSEFRKQLDPLLELLDQARRECSLEIGADLGGLLERFREQTFGLRNLAEHHDYLVEHQSDGATELFVEARQKTPTEVIQAAEAILGMLRATPDDTKVAGSSSPGSKASTDSEVRKAVILTALPEEFAAVQGHLIDAQEETHPMGTVYWRGTFPGKQSKWEVLLVEVGAGNSGAATEAERAIAYFAPEVALFVGIAGGIRDVTIGDVVVATKVHGYESGKDGASGFAPRPDVGQSAYALVQRARAVAHISNLIHGKVWVGPIAAGEKVLASTQSETAKLLRAQYGDALAVEMEGRGFLVAAHANQPVFALVVRGISDLLDGKSEADAKGSHELAASHAAKVAFEILSQHVPPPRHRSGSSKDAAGASTPSTDQAQGPTLTADEFALWADKLGRFRWNLGGGVWEIRLIPSPRAAPMDHDTIRARLREATLSKRGWHFPQTDRGTLENHSFGVQLSLDTDPYRELGVFLRTGSCCYARRLWEDSGLHSTPQRPMPAGAGLEFIVATQSLAEPLLFWSRYSSLIGHSGKVKYQVIVHECLKRRLFTLEPEKYRIRKVMECAEGDVTVSRDIESGAIASTWKDVAVSMAVDLLALFNWADPGPDRSLLLSALNRFEEMAE